MGGFTSRFTSQGDKYIGVVLHGIAQFDLSQPCMAEAEAPGSPRLGGGNTRLPAAAWQK